MSIQKFFKNQFSVIAATAVMALGLSTGTATAVPVDGGPAGDVTNEVIMGTGISNGSWTGVNVDGLELALRGKLRYNGAGAPENTFNYDGDHTYVFDNRLSLIPANRSVFNFEFSINSDADTTNTQPGTENRNLDMFTYVLEFDTDPTGGTSFLSIDPMAAFADNSYGNNDTAQSAGVEGTFAALGGDNNLAQNSQNLGFGFSATPYLPGTYTFNLIASGDQGEVARTSIDIRVLPEPGTLALFGLGLVGLVWRAASGLPEQPFV